MSNAGRHPLFADWSLAFQNAGSKACIGEGLGGGDGWSPKWGQFLLERAYLQGRDFAMAGTAPDVFFEVEKNGATSLYDLSYTMTTTSGANANHIVTDTTQHVLEPTDYITAEGGHRNYVGGTFVSKDVGFMLEGRYITGPLAGRRVHVGRRGIVRLFHISGSMNTLSFVFNFMGTTNKAGLTGYPATARYKGWPVPAPMVIRRQVISVKVNSPTVTPDMNQLTLSTYVDDPTGTADMQRVISLNTSIGQELTRTDLSGTEVDVGNELFFELEQVRAAGSGTALLVDISCYLEVEYR